MSSLRVRVQQPASDRAAVLSLSLLCFTEMVQGQGQGEGEQPGALRPGACGGRGGLLLGPTRAEAASGAFLQRTAGECSAHSRRDLKREPVPVW